MARSSIGVNRWGKPHKYLWGNPDTAWPRFYQYGLRRSEFDVLLKKQEGRCAVCRCEFDSSVRPHVDHDHLTKGVRGLLCWKCNIGIGLLGDSVESLKKALDYLQSSAG